jgi:cell division FtsZ-interacting protein ZapD
MLQVNLLLAKAAIEIFDAGACIFDFPVLLAWTTLPTMQTKLRKLLAEPRDLQPRSAPTDVRLVLL